MESLGRTVRSMRRTIGADRRIGKIENMFDLKRSWELAKRTNHSQSAEPTVKVKASVGAVDIRGLEDAHTSWLRSHGVNGVRARLSEVEVQVMMISCSDFSNAEFESCVLSDASLDKVSLDGARIVGCDLSTECAGHIPSISDCSFEEAVFDGCRFDGRVFETTSFAHSRFTNCSFIGCSFRRHVFIGAVFDGCIFDGSIFSQCIFGNAAHNDCSFENAVKDVAKPEMYSTLMERIDDAIVSAWNILASSLFDAEPRHRRNEIRITPIRIREVENHLDEQLFADDDWEL